MLWYKVASRNVALKIFQGEIFEILEIWLFASTSVTTSKALIWYVGLYPNIREERLIDNGWTSITLFTNTLTQTHLPPPKTPMHVFPPWIR